MTELYDSVTRNFFPHYRLYWEHDDAFWSVEPAYRSEDEIDVAYREFQNSDLVIFDIVAVAPHIKTLELFIGTYNQQNDAHLFVELLSKTSIVLARSTTYLGKIPNNQFSSVLDLHGVDFEPGEKYPVRMFWVGKPGARIAIRGSSIKHGLGRYELPRRLDRLSDERVFALPVHLGALPDEMDRAVVVTPDLAVEQLGKILEGVRAAFPGVSFRVSRYDDAARNLSELRSASVVVFASIFQAQSRSGLRFDELCFDLHRHGVCTIFFDGQSLPLQTVAELSWSGAAAGELRWQWQQARRCHFIASEGLGLLSTQSNSRLALLSEVQPFRIDCTLLAKLVATVRSPATPRVAIVTVLDRSAAMETFLDCVIAQSYPGEISVQLVKVAREKVEAPILAYAYRLAESGIVNRRVTVIEGAAPSDRDGSRFAALAACDADILIALDVDCLINRDFVAAHIFEHWWDDVDVVIGCTNIETGDEDPIRFLHDIEASSACPAAKCEPQDPILPESFINFGTANFSIKNRLLSETSLFESAGYTSPAVSGIDWQAIETGFRLYRKGGIVRHTNRAFAVRRPRPSRILASNRIVSARDFARLLERNPDVALVSRRWAFDAYSRLIEKQEELGLATEPDLGKLTSLLAVAPKPLPDLSRSGRGVSKRLRVLTYRWHAAHQYEIYKLPHEFTLVTGTGPSLTNGWAFDQRPLRPNARMVDVQRIDPRDFDVALLHFDENVYAVDLSNQNLPANWGNAFDWALSLDNLPKIAVCHGTPPFVGQYAADPVPMASFIIHEDARQFLVNRLAEAKATVVCNSYQAQSEWNYVDSRVIWHGFDPQEFPPATLERDVLSLAADIARPHYRGAWELEQIKARLSASVRVETATHDTAPIENRSQNAFAVRQFRGYVDRIRQFKIYLNTTLRSPMPRSRGEAMMTGVIPVSLRNHDIDRFVENGVDGFYADDPSDLAEFIIDLLRDEMRIQVMSRAARQKALEIFNSDRYLAEWGALLRDVCG